jgi:uncharacterized protein YaiI (UPF0178 family)
MHYVDAAHRLCYYMPMLVLYVDGDACPVKTEALQVAERHDMQVYIVSNSGLRPVANPKVQMVLVDAGADAADDWIAERISTGDVAVTADILLADRCLKAGGKVLSPYGKPFTEANIGQAVAGRSVSAHLREMGGVSYNPSFGKQDRSRFLQELENMIQSIKRQ